MTSTVSTVRARLVAHVLAFAVLASAVTAVAPAAPLAGTATAAPPLLTPDLAWSDDGRSSLDTGPGRAACDIGFQRILADGSMVAVSECPWRAHQVVISRYSASGAFDPTYGDAIAPGHRTFPETVDGMTFHRADVADDGSAVLVWQGTSDGDLRERYVRIGAGGDPVASFGSAGTATITLAGAAGWDHRWSTIDATGSVITMFDTGTETAFVRVGPDGLLDTDFDGDGIVTRPANAWFPPVVSVGPTGAITWLRAGAYYDPAWIDLQAERLTPSGALDPTFDGDGIVGFGTVDPADLDGANAAFGPSGEIVVVTAHADGSGQVVRVAADGQLDPSLDGDGVLDASAGLARGGIVLDPADSSVITFETDGSSSLALSRISADGATIDASVFTPADGSVPMHLVGLDSNGRLVVTSIEMDWDTLTLQDRLVRLTPSFSQDLTFGTDGVVDVPAPLFDPSSLRPDGTIRIIRRSIVQLTDDGQLDPSWGGDGSIDHDVPQGMFDTSSGVLVDASGRTLVAIESFSEDPGLGTVSLGRLGADGEPDPSFGGGDGVVTIEPVVPIGAALTDEPEIELGGLDATGGTLATVHIEYDLGGSSFARDQIVRVDGTGVVDPTYPRSTAASLEIVHVFGDGSALVLLDGELIRLGTDGNPSPDFTSDDDVPSADWVVLRDGRIRGCTDTECRAWNADGTPDASFGAGSGGSPGDLAIPPPPGLPSDHQSWAAASSITDDGGAVLLLQEVDANFDDVGSHVLRLLPDGRPDPTFGDDGWVVLPAPPSAPGGAAGWYDLAIVQSGIALLTRDGGAAPSDRYQVARLDRRGALDTDFGTDGFAAIADSPHNPPQLFPAGAAVVAWNPHTITLVSATGETTSAVTGYGTMAFPWASLITMPDALVIAGTRMLSGAGYATVSLDAEVTRYEIDDTTSAIASLLVTADHDLGTTVGVTPVVADVRSNDATNSGSMSPPDIVGAPSHGTATVRGDGSLGYVADAGWTGIDVITYRVCSETDTMRCAVATWTITVTAPPAPSPPATPPPARAIEVVDPDRLFDTRPGEPQGAITVTKQKYGGPDVLRVRLAGVSGVPATDVAAVSLNITAVDPDAAGYLTLYPCGERPTVSSINFTPSSVVANAVIVPVSSDGELCVASNTRTHVVADVNGWFRTGSGFTAVAPRRLADTRDGEPDGAIPVTKRRHGGATVLRLPVTGVAGIPVGGVGAVALNVTAVVPVAAGFLTVFPCGELPLASNVNFVGGQVVANAVVAPVSAAGEVCVFSNAPTDVVVDVNGWFATGAGFTAVAPARLFDTRPTEPQGGVRVEQSPISPTRPLRVRVTGVAGVPTTGVGAVSLNVTVDGPTGAGFVTVYPCGAVPPTSSLNFAAGQVVPNAVVAPVSADGEICLVSNVSTHVLADVNGWFLAGVSN